MLIEITQDGRRYEGEVHEVDGFVTVLTDAGGKAETALGGSRLEPLARILLRQLVSAGKAHALSE